MDRTKEYMLLQDVLRVPDDPEDTPRLAKALAESMADEQIWRLSIEVEAQKWWTAIDIGAVIQVDDEEETDGEGSELSCSFWNAESSDDGEDGNNVPGGLD
jgi:hypothetical protein